MYHALKPLIITDSSHRDQQSGHFREAPTLQGGTLEKITSQGICANRWMFVKVHLRKHLPFRWYPLGLV